MNGDDEMGKLIELTYAALSDLVGNCLVAQGDAAAIDATIRICATRMATAYYQGIEDALKLSPAFCDAMLKAASLGEFLNSESPQSGAPQ